MACVKGELKESTGVIHDSVQHLYQPVKNFNHSSTPGTNNHVTQVGITTRSCQSYVVQPDHVTHVKMEVEADPKMMTYDVEDSHYALRNNFSTSPFSTSYTRDSTYSRFNQFPASIVSAKDESHNKEDRKENRQVSLARNFKEYVHCSQSVLIPCEDYILPHDSENDSSSDTYEETFKTQATSARQVPCPHETMIFSCDECQKPVKIESKEPTEKFMENNFGGSCSILQNDSDSSIKYAKYTNNSCGPTIYPEPEEAQPSKMDVKVSEVTLNDVQTFSCNLNISANPAIQGQGVSHFSENTQTCVTRGKLENFENRFFPCDECGKVFRRQNNLKEHLAYHSEERPFSCEQCGKAFKTRCDLRAHLKCHSEEKPYSCEHCGKGFKSHRELASHLISHSNERPFFCEQCGKAFKTRRELGSHLICHSDERPFFCKQCGKGFKTSILLRIHMVSHSDKRPFPCRQCGKAFKTSSNLETHLLTHSEVRPFSCEQCGKAFKTRGKLGSHLKTHSQHKPFSCDQCGKAFKRGCELRCHLASHSEERPFSCEQCRRAFKTRAYLKEHLTIHSEQRPFSCELCGKAFKTRIYLKDHLTTHSNYRPFSCEHCGKSFKTYGELRSHLRYHSGERPYSCEYCEKSFKTRVLLKSHLKSHVAKDLFLANSTKSHSNTIHV